MCGAECPGLAPGYAVCGHVLEKGLLREAVFALESLELSRVWRSRVQHVLCFGA